jgi:Lipid A 3-O-deacylase (PagL)
MRMARIALVATLLGTMLALSPAVTRADDADLTRADDATAAPHANDCRLHIAEWSLLIAGGVNPSNVIQYLALHGDLGFPLWESADRWFTKHNMTARWIVEPWIAFVDDQHGIHKTESFEIGISPLFGKLTFGDWRVRPFIEGGEGIMYTDLRKQRFGTPFNFSSQFGAGLEYQIRPDLTFTFAARIRHMSNAGLASTNPGINTYFGLVGLTFR